MRRIGVLLFDGVEELDVAGPYEVFAWAASLREDLFDVKTVAQSLAPVRCNKGLRIVPDTDFAECPALDILVVPGGAGTRIAWKDENLLAFVRRQAETCEWITSVCTGLRILLAAGPAQGRRVTTYFGTIDEMRRDGRVGEVLENVRFVRDGQLVTSAGVSAGIDMALWLVGEVTGEPAFAREVQQGIEYFPAPPYAA